MKRQGKMCMCIFAVVHCVGEAGAFVTAKGTTGICRHICDKAAAEPAVACTQRVLCEEFASFENRHLFDFRVKVKLKVPVFLFLPSFILIHFTLDPHCKMALLPRHFC